MCIMHEIGFNKDVTNQNKHLQNQSLISMNQLCQRSKKKYCSYYIFILPFVKIEGQKYTAAF